MVTNYLLDETVMDASIAEAAMDAFEAMQAHGKFDADVQFRVSARFVSGFKSRFNLSSHIRCGESSSANLEGIQTARDAAPRISWI